MTKHDGLMLWLDEVALTAAAVTVAIAGMVIRDWWRRR